MKHLLWLAVLLAVGCPFRALAHKQPPTRAARVAIVGGGVGGTAAAFFLRQANPSWHIEL